VEGMHGALAYVAPVREDIKVVAAATYGKIPEILADVAILGLVERSFKSSVLELAGRELLGVLPAADAPDEEWLGYVAILRALRRHLSEDDLVGYAAELEAAVQETHNPALQARVILLASWTLEDYPAAKKSLERKFRELAKKYNEAVLGVLPPMKKGWRAKGRHKSKGGGGVR